MTDYKKLAVALRNNDWSDACPCCDEAMCKDADCIILQAADAIEALQAEQKKTVTQIFGEEQMAWEEYCTGLMSRISELKSQLPKRGEWIRVREVDIPGEMHPVAFRCMCSMCRNEYVFPRVPQYCPDCGSMNTSKMEVQYDK